jgi:hypothetical protein
MRSAGRLGMALCLLSWTGTTVAAQAAVGAHVGYLRSDLVGADAAELRGRQGALTGVFVNLPLGRALSVRPELLFTQKGGRTEATLEDGSSATIDIELAYFEFPLLARLTLPRGRLRPILFAGMSPALRIGCDLQLETNEGPVLASCDEAEFTVIRNGDLGIVVGAGVEMIWVEAALALEARYNRGMSSIIDGFEVHNRAYSLVLTLTF